MQVSATVRDIARLAHAPVGEEERDAHCQYHDYQPDHKAAPCQTTHNALLWDVSASQDASASQPSGRLTCQLQITGV
jgi:hypothetical protein